MDGQTSYPDAAQRIMNIVQATCGTRFTYFLGLPDQAIFPEDAFPVIVVDKTVGTFEVGPTTADDITEAVYIHLILDLKTGMGGPDTVNTVKRQLQLFVEGRDPATGYLATNTIMYALRSNLTLNSAPVPGQVTINNNIRVAYDKGEYKDMPETREAVIEVTVYERLMIPDRAGSE